LAARAILRPGDVAACESPSFAGIIDALNATGARVLPVPVDERGLRVDALEAMLRSTEIKLVALQPRLQNPTGCDLDSERAAELLELARRHGFFVLEDGVYAPLRFEGNDPGPLRPRDPARVIHVNSLSKVLCAGLRIGWLAASGPVLDRLIAEKYEADMTSPTLTQQLTARYLAAGDQRGLIATATKVYRKRRDTLLAALESEMTGLAHWTRPIGGGHLWLTLRRARAEEPLHRAALANGVSYLPGSAALVEPPSATHMRISYGACPVEQISEGVRRLAAAVRMQPQANHRDTTPGA
jgi:2-aminoadipate transaminase